jgi:hypothetical protein
MSRVNGKKIPVTPLPKSKHLQPFESPPLTATTPVVINTEVGALPVGNTKIVSPSTATIFNAAGKPGVHPITHKIAKDKAGIKRLTFEEMPDSITKGPIRNNENEQGGGRRSKRRRQTKKQIKRKRQTRRR